MSEITEQTHPQEVLPPQPDPRAFNAVQHGLGCEQVPPSERAGYAAHLQAVRESSGAQSYLEQRLADRAALALWRLERVARYEAAQSSTQRRELADQIEASRAYGPAGGVKAAYDRLSELSGETPEVHRADPGASEEEAQLLDAAAQVLDSWAAGGSAGGVSRDEASHLGQLLADTLEEASVPPAQMVRAMLGRPARRGEADTLETGEWVYEVGEVPGLLQLYRDRLGGRPGERGALMLGTLARRERDKAQALRAAQEEVGASFADALALAALPQEKVLEKITRYEAHLERSLYRSLHELEAARRGREGQDTPGPLRMVLEVPEHDR